MDVMLEGNAKLCIDQVDVMRLLLPRVVSCDKDSGTFLGETCVSAAQIVEIWLLTLFRYRPQYVTQII
jgi:hypothetical protein